MEKNQMEKRYGLFTAICMVVGIVIGSGVFFKAQDILNYTGGNMLIGILAWVIGGIVMIICAFNFANFGTKYVRVNGVVDYAESIVGPRYAYMIGWFLTTIYYPAMTGVLAWVSARYTLVLFGSDDITGGLCMALGGLYLCLAYAVNVLSPKIAGKFQVSATVVKLIPLGIIVVVGTIAGLINGNTVDAFKGAESAFGGAGFDSIFAGIGAAAFAYEGWIIATSINSELKEPKKNLPRALVIGTAIIMAIYILYFVGLVGGASVDELRTGGATVAFKNLFGGVGSTILNVFIVVSCLGTLNGLMLANTRSLYSLSVRGNGPKPQTFAQLDPQTNMPANSGALTLLFAGAWFFYFYGANLTNPIFGVFSFDSSELPIITIYALYIPIFVMFIVKEGKKDVFKNIVMPILAIIASLFMVFVAVYAHGISKYQSAKELGNFSFPVLFYLIVFAVIMAVGLLLYRRKNKK
ncbi:MAG: amino acid permease [Clostridia bacterium]|nr:amino acid permease [Clostridia bacterium]